MVQLELLASTIYQPSASHYTTYFIINTVYGYSNQTLTLGNIVPYNFNIVITVRSALLVPET